MLELRRNDPGRLGYGSSRARPPPSAEVVAHRLTLRGIPRSLYERLRQAVGDGLPRLTYDRRTPEMEMPPEAHEALKWLAGRFVEAYAAEAGVDHEAVGSTTWRRHSV